MKLECLNDTLLMANQGVILIFRIVTTDFCGCHLEKHLKTALKINRNTSIGFPDPEHLGKDNIVVTFS